MNERVSLKDRTTGPTGSGALSHEKKAVPSSGINSAHDIPFLQKTIGNQAVHRLFKSGTFQPKLSISRPNDPYEQEADRIAEQVLIMPEPAIESKTASISYNIDPLNGKKSNEGGSHTKHITPLMHCKTGPVESKGNNQNPSGSASESGILSLRETGRPLPESVRSYFEPRFGYDFSGVRVHTETKASESARAINAKAFTFGNDIAFDQEEYSPDTASGRRLLGHELTHVVQQNRGDISSPTSTPEIMRQQAAGQSSPELLQSAETVAVSGGYTPGSAPQPRSLTLSLNPMQLSDDELLNEIMRIQQWLQNNTGPGPERNQLMLTLTALELQAGTRKTAGYTRQYGLIAETAMAALPGGKISAELGKLGAGFSSGFLQGSLLSIPEHSYRDLATELTIPENSFYFTLGMQAGLPVGALKDLKDNVVGLAELALYLNPLYQTYRSFKKGLEFIEAPGRTIERDIETAKGLMEFVYALEADPAFLLTQGEALGIHLGGESGYWFNATFMKMHPVMKGFTVGEIIGYIAFEIVLLFLPFEWLIKGTQASRVALAGSKLGQALLKVLERAPGISRIIKAHRVFEEARAVEKAAEAGKVIEKTAEAGKTVEKAAPGKTTPEPVPAKAEPVKPPEVTEKIGELQGSLKQIEQELVGKNAEKLKSESEVTARYKELQSAQRKMEKFPEKKPEFEKIVQEAEEKYEDTLTKTRNLEEDISKLQAEKVKITNEIYRIEKGIQYPIDSATRSILEEHGFTNYDEVTGIASKENGSIKIQKTEGGWKYIKKDKVVAEYEIAAYKNNKPGTESFFQAHHSIQDAWAKDRLGELGYNPNEAPTILLRDSLSGTPHQIISERQAARFDDIGKRTYLEEREWMVKDMENIGVPPEVQKKALNEVDNYFRKMRDKIQDPKLREKLFGNWEG